MPVTAKESQYTKSTKTHNGTKVAAHNKASTEEPSKDEIAKEATVPSLDMQLEQYSAPGLRLKFEVDIISVVLLVFATITRMWRLDEPRNIVFDELHYGKYISLYMKNTFFFDTHPPFGKQLVALVAHLAGYDGKFKFDRIGSSYSESVPLFALRFVPALFGSLIVPLAYHLMLELQLSHWTALLAALLVLLDNALLTQSRFVLMESLLLFFSLFGILCVLKYRRLNVAVTTSTTWINNEMLLSWMWLTLGAASLTLGVCVKYTGFYTCCLGALIILRGFWPMLASRLYSDLQLVRRFAMLALIGVTVPVLCYLAVFYVHLRVLHRAGPHDSIMTSAFQASLEGGLASITKGQPLVVAHGSQITLRHTHGRTCWLHSHQHVYPVRYSDKRGSSHQQQVTCYSFKDVNNWWIVKRPEKNDLVVEEPVDAIRHGDVIQLVHGITSRALNSHDVAAPQSPQCQEVSCYIDYNVSMPSQNRWRVDVVNSPNAADDSNDDGNSKSTAMWHTIQSQVRLVHVDSGQALKFTGRQLPDWGFHQHEVAADRIINQDDTVWNVEEHRYTKSEDQKERERDMVSAEMIPTQATTLSFWAKFYELHYKMMFSSTDGVQNHMYSSEPLEWPLMSRGIAYYISSTSNAQIHLLGNYLIWCSATLAVCIYLALMTCYLLRRRRLCYDITDAQWQQFQLIGDVLFCGYLMHYIPYFFVERTLFLHHYLPAFTFKVLLLAACIEHLSQLMGNLWIVRRAVTGAIIGWLTAVALVFQRFCVLSYGTTDLTTEDIVSLRWKDTWDFIVHKNS